ncbi:GPO family capsid scaffolding protein [Klebsiella pneumoniae]|uniref:GPO family capsid scaffolding protein n=1 Tax=Klebsiella pneumoniae TaxID=573 RepID=A0A939SW98_KLEPN|nr:GPO family capsid scaffolding protein [Klebsiella pneumoniae]
MGCCGAERRGIYRRAAGRLHWTAEIEPSERMKQMTDGSIKVYSSIELHPQLPLTARLTDGLCDDRHPGKPGTERLKFAAQQRASVMAFNNQQVEAPMITEAIEAK